jgi:O-antigen/teichoic acid export membrane protein
LDFGLNRFSRSVALTLAARVLMAANSVLSGVIVARWLGAEGLGALAALNVAVNTAMQISNLGVSTANTYFIAQDKTRAATAAANSALFAVLSGGGFALALWLCAVWQPGFPANLPSKIVAVAAAALPFQLATLLGINIFLALGRVREFNGLDLLNQSFVIINAVIALALLRGDLRTLVSFNAAAGAGVGLLTCGLLYRYLSGETEETRGRWRFDFGQLRETLRYALKGHVLWVATLLVWRVDVLLVAHWRGAAEAGVYSVATQFTLFLLLLPNAVSQLMLARVAATQETAAEFTCRAARHTALLIFAACLASITLSYALPLLYGPAFAAVPQLIWLLLPGVFFMALQAVLVQYFVGTGLPRVIPALWALTLILNLALNAWFIPAHGARGAALVSTLTYTFIFCAVWLRFRRATGRKLREILILEKEEWQGGLKALKAMTARKLRD